MITVSVLPIKDFLRINKKSEKESYSIQQIKAFGKDEYINELRNYLDEIKNKCNYLIRILNVLSLLSREYHISGDKEYFGEKTLFNDVFQYINKNISYFNNSCIHECNIKENDINSPFLFHFLLKIINENKINKKNIVCKKEPPSLYLYLYNIYLYLDLVVFYFKRKIKEISMKKTKRSLDVIKNKLTDVYIETIREFNIIFYKEFIRYCNILKNDRFLFFLDVKYIDFFGPNLSDEGDNNQKKIIDDCISEFNELILEIDKCIIDKKKYFDKREFLFENYGKLRIYFDELKKLPENKEKKYVMDDNEHKTFIWSGTNRELIVLIMKLINKEDTSKSFWNPIDGAFDKKNKLWDNARQYLKDKNDKEFKNNVSSKIDGIINEVEKKLQDKTPKLLLSKKVP